MDSDPTLLLSPLQLLPPSALLQRKGVCEGVRVRRARACCTMRVHGHVWVRAGAIHLTSANEENPMIAQGR